jgi:membrane protease YdiL (CAAX protease family)
MLTSEDSLPQCERAPAPSGERRVARDLFEVVFGYVLILSVIWTQRPMQKWLYYAAIAWFVCSTVSSFPGWKAMGCSIVGFRRSLWVVGVALLMALSSAALASYMHTLHHPAGPIAWVTTFGGYTIWALVQQFLLQGYFLLRLTRLLNSCTWAAVIAGTVFAVAHLPNPILTPVTLLWGLIASFVFLRSRNIFPLAIAHAIFGISLAVTIPAATLHNMRVGLGYLKYQKPQPLHLSQMDHNVSTVVWVKADAATRRSARHALP